MSYTKHNYKKGDELLASQLNDMDDQIALNEQTADTLVTVSNTQPSATKNRVWVKATPSEIEIPTMEDHNELSRQLSDIEENQIPELNNAFNNALGDAFINIVDPSVVPVNLYPNGTIFSVADFIYSLPVKVKPNTTYTVMQKTPSLSFRCSISDEYPALNVTCTIVGGNNNTSPKHFTTGANTQYLLVGYKNTRQSETYTPYDLMVAEGNVSEFVEIGKFEITDQMLGAVADDHIKNIVTEENADSERIIDAIQTDRNKAVYTFNSGLYGLRNGYFADGIYYPSSSSQVVTYDFIDCRGVKYINFGTGEKYVYISWYSAPNEESFTKNSGEWLNGNPGFSIIPEGNFMRFGVRNPSGTAIQPSYGEMNISFTGIDCYNEQIAAKKIPAGYKLVNCYDDFVMGSVSYFNGDEIVTATSRISSMEYIDLSGMKKIYMSVGEGYKYNLVFFDVKGGAAVYYTNYTNTAKEYNTFDYKYAKIIIQIDSGRIFTGEAITLTVASMYLNEIGSQYEYQMFNSTSIKADFLKGASIHIESQENANVIVSNGNFLDPAYYEGAHTTKNGIRFMVDDDGCVIANGTATNNADFILRGSSEPVISFDGTPWCLSGLPEGSESGKYFIYTTNHGDNEGYGTIDDDTDIGYIYLRIRTGVTVENLKFYPMLTIGRGKSQYKKGKIIKYTGKSFDINTFMDSETMIASDKPITVTGYATRYKEEVQKRNFVKYKKPYPIAIGHRGLLTEAPENTVYAFRAAIDANLDIMESDIQFTSDHVPVMFHDPTIDRVVTGHTGTIREYTWAQVQGFDVYTYFQNQYPEKWKPEFVNARIMSLDEYLAFCKGVGIPSCLEIKSLDFTHDEIMTVIELVEKYNYVDQVLWGGTFNTVRGLYPILHKYPESTAVLGFDNVVLDNDNIKKLKLVNTGENAFGVSLSAQAAQSISVVKDMGIIILQYMIDSTSDALAVDPCVTGMMSNSGNVRTMLKNYYMA